MPAAGGANVDPAGWIDRRYHDDLDPDAERAIRAAGLAWCNEPEAERRLAEAAAIAPDHPAVLIAQYRYCFYKHRYGSALVHAEAILAAAARRLNVPVAWREVRRCDLDALGPDADVRFWLFVLQAYGYVLIRLGRHGDGIAALAHLASLDVHDATRTGTLLSVIARAGADE